MNGIEKRPWKVLRIQFREKDKQLIRSMGKDQ